MSNHFRSGQTVRLARGVAYRSAAGGEYKVVALLPDEGVGRRYRVKSVREPHERVVSEEDLESV